MPLMAPAANMYSAQAESAFSGELMNLMMALSGDGEAPDADVMEAEQQPRSEKKKESSAPDTAIVAMYIAAVVVPPAGSFGLPTAGDQAGPAGGAVESA